MTRNRLAVWIGPLLGLLSVSCAQNNKSAVAYQPAPPPSSTATPMRRPEPSPPPRPDDSVRPDVATGAREPSREVAPAAAADSQVWAALQRVLPEAEFEQTPFGAVVLWLAHALGISIHVDWQELEDAGIEPDTRVTIRLRDVTGECLLRVILEEVGGDRWLAYDVGHGVLVITTMEQLERQMTTRAYNVRDLLLGGNSPSEAEFFYMVIDSVHPDAWEANGGLGTAEVRNGLLAVHNSPRVHRTLEGLLDALRRVPENGRASVPPMRDRLLPEDDRIRGALERMLASVSFDGTPLRAVVRQLREQLDINIHVYWQLLEDAGVEPEAPVRMNLQSVTAAQVLERIFDAFAQVRLDYRIDGNVLFISTQEHLWEQLGTCVYDVRDLAPSGAARQELIEYIVDRVEPDSWVQNAGLGTLAFVGHRLVVHNYEWAHDKLAWLLELLRNGAPG